MKNFKIKEYYNSILPKFLKVNGITIGNRIFYSESKENVSTRLRIHEKEHVKQYAKEGILCFLIRYFYEYILNRFKGMKHQDAYLNISYEIKARKAEERA